MKKNDFKTLAFALISLVGAFSVAPIFAADAKTERVFCDCANRCCCVGCDCGARVGCDCCGGAGCAASTVALTYPEPYDGSERVPNRITVQIGGSSPVPGWRPWRPAWRPGWRPVPPPVPPRPGRPEI